MHSASLHSNHKNKAAMTRLEKLQWLIAWFEARRSELPTQPAMVDAIKQNREVEDVVRDLYFALYNKPLSGCSSCLSDALILILNSEKRMKQINACRFKLKTGVLLQDSKGILPDATVANLTDEIAIAYLRDNANRRAMFEVVPDDLDALLAQAPEKVAEQDEKKPATGDEKPEGEQVPTEEEKAQENANNAEEGAELTAEKVKAMSYNELKAEAAKRGMKVVGVKKDELIDALLATL